MHFLNSQAVFAGVFSGLVLFGITGMAPDPSARSSISADEFVQAMGAHRASVIDLYLNEHRDPNARTSHDQPLILAAALEQDWPIVRRLLAAGASVDLGDETGLKPLMAAAMSGNADIINEFIPLVTNIAAADRTGRTALHYAVAAGKAAAVEILLPLVQDIGTQCSDGSDLLGMALASGNSKIVEFILQRMPPQRQWSTGARRALEAALASGNKDQIRLLLSKHTTPPAPEGRSVPLLAYAIASSDLSLFNLLLSCGADPNTVLPDKCDKEFLASLPSKSLQNYIPGDKGVTALMLAAGIGQADYVRALLDAGADRNRATKRYKMLALYLSAQNDQWRCTQLLLGSGPSPDQLHIEISLSSQHVAVVKDGVPIFNTVCSTGRQGYSTRAGSYVITDKDRSHRSTIYKVEMPYFMRLSCLDFGMHEGVVPNYPASHGCIRLPSEAARKLFAEIPVGTLVTVQ
jgi:ankyrin repeat protein